MRKAGLALIGIWVLLLLGAILGLVPKWAEFAGIGAGLVGLILTWVARRQERDRN